MANPFHPFFGQVITQTDLSEILDTLVAGVDRFVQDFGYSGIVTGGTVTQHTPANLTADIEAPTIVYDQVANRIQFDSPVVVNLAVDENGAATTLVGNSNEKWLSIYLQFTSTPSQPNTDDLGNTVYYRDIYGYKLNVAQGSEAPAGAAVPPALRGDQILLADVKRSFSTTAFVNADISIARAQTVIDVSSSPLSIKAKGFKDALLAILNSINAVSAVVSSGVATMNTRIDDLSASNLDTANVTGSPRSLSASTIYTAIASLVGFVNELWARPVALRDVENSFTGIENSFNTIKTVAAVDQNAFFTQANLGSGNKWAHVWEIRLDGSHKVHIYIGSTASLYGAFAVTWNAWWNIGTQRWNRHDAGKPAVAVVWLEGEPRLCRSTSAEWETWPEATIYGAAFAYSGYIDRTSDLSFDRVWPGIRTLMTSFSEPIPFRLPHGAKLSSIEVKVFQQGASPCQVSVGAYSYNWNDENASVGFVTVAGVTSAPGGGGHHIFSVDCGDHVIDNTDSYYITINGGQVNDYLFALRAKWKDPGPRNH